MNDSVSGSIETVGHRLRMLVALVITWLVTCPVHAAPRPGEALEVPVQTQAGPVTLRFRYCPAGQAISGQPREIPMGDSFKDKMLRGSMLTKLKDFYVTETELSQEQFRAIMGEEVMAAVSKRLLNESASGAEPKLPVRGVTLSEIAKFCETLEVLDRQNQSGGPSLEDRRFRIPSHVEWQYASRAIQDVNEIGRLPHFNAWPGLQSLPGDVVSDCQDVWQKNLGRQDPFLGSQDQVIEVILAHKNPIRGVEILSTFLQVGLGTNRDLASAALGPQPVGNGFANNWNIKEMHGNVFEWTINEKNTKKVSSIWQALLTGQADMISEDEPATFFLAGGGYNHALGRNVSDWPSFSIWGGQPMKDGEDSSFTFTQIEDENVVQDFLPGVRLLLERRLADDWVFIIRQEAVFNSGASLNEIKQRLDVHRQSVRELAIDTSLERSESTISFYEALASYERGQKDNAAKMILDSSDVLAKQDPFFKHLSKVVQADTN